MPGGVAVDEFEHRGDRDVGPVPRAHIERETRELSACELLAVREVRKLNRQRVAVGVGIVPEGCAWIAAEHDRESLALSLGAMVAGTEGTTERAAKRGGQEQLRDVADLPAPTRGSETHRFVAAEAARVSDPVLDVPIDHLHSEDPGGRPSECELRGGVAARGRSEVDATVTNDGAEAAPMRTAQSKRRM